MTFEIRGGVRAAALPGATPFARQSARLLGDLRLRDADPAFIQARAQQEEADGCDSALVTLYSAWPDPWLVASWALASTERLCITLAHRPGVTQPTVAARALATLDRLSGGRVAVHIVMGSSDADVQRDGDFLGKAARYQRAVEYLEVFTRTLAGHEPFDYRGEHYQVVDAGSGVLPVQRPHPPISIGGTSPQARQLAARFADIYAGGFPTPEVTREVIAEVSALAAGHGRQLRFWKDFKVILGSSDSEAEQRAQRLRTEAEAQLQARSLGALASSPQIARDRERASQSTRDPQALRDWVLAETRQAFEGVLVGSVATVAERLLAFHRAGIDIVQIEASTEDEEDSGLRRQLIAHLRKVAGDG